ncbi:DUF234 domain-containing protein [Frankia sp. R82]|uniref:DUF234 domain-containing protein n=1 Tax=Frankia sp. R82 TaxID=2950553 RepID=UPI00204498BF|nr:DUF234 domain-containing protein [Frankia sp. R82]MCM3885698.1 DUF234 domain-containing protein [Frankia sp. R82]
MVAVGPYWSTGGRNEIDAVVLAGRDRHPVLFGEARWARSVDGRRIFRPAFEKGARCYLGRTSGPGAPDTPWSHRSRQDRDGQC